MHIKHSICKSLHAQYLPNASFINLEQQNQTDLQSEAKMFLLTVNALKKNVLSFDKDFNEGANNFTNSSLISVLLRLKLKD